jgi:hypothetical protein
MTRSAAVARQCANCGRTLGARRSHYVASGVVFCGACVDKPSAHTMAHPECAESWHDLHDHYLSMATRAGVTHALARAQGGELND